MDELIIDLTRAKVELDNHSNSLTLFIRDIHLNGIIAKNSFIRIDQNPVDGLSYTWCFSYLDIRGFDVTKILEKRPFNSWDSFADHLEEIALVLRPVNQDSLVNIITEETESDFEIHLRDLHFAFDDSFNSSILKLINISVLGLDFFTKPGWTRHMEVSFKGEITPAEVVRQFYELINDQGIVTMAHPSTAGDIDASLFFHQTDTLITFDLFVPADTHEWHDSIREFLGIISQINLSPFKGRKQLHFPPHLKQAGQFLLSYFSEIITQKYPDDDVNISISQDGSEVVELTITAANGDVLDKVEGTLGLYGEVLVGGKPISALLESRIQQDKLVEKVEQAMLIAKSDQRYIALQEEVIKQNTVVINQQANQLTSQTQQIGELIRQTAQLATFNLTRLQSKDKEVNRLIRKIERLSKTNTDLIDKTDLLEILEQIDKKDKSVIAYLADMTQSATGSVFGRLLYETLQML